jgi:ArsR family transcriptional regulator
MKNPIGTRTLTAHLADLGEPVRLRILRLLEREELSVGEVANVVQLPQSTVSRHLKVLSDGGWLMKRAEGTATFFRLVLDDLPFSARSLWLAVREQMSPGGAETTELAEDSRRLASVLAERRTDSQAFFGRVAGEWDDLRNDLFGDRFTLRGLLALLPREWTVADLGCGTGNAAEYLAPLVKRVIAVDQSPAMLKAARKRLEAFDNITFLRGEIYQLPMDDCAANAAVAVLVLHHLEDPVMACREVRRVLKPGGVFLAIDMLEHDRETYRHTMGHRWLGFSAERISAVLTDAGFTDPRFTILPSDPDARGPGLFACTAFRPS